jgi:hypothetical protein
VELLRGSVREATVLAMTTALEIKVARRHVHGQAGAGTMITMAVAMAEHLAAAAAAVLLPGSSSLLPLLLLQEDHRHMDMEVTQDLAMIQAMAHPQEQHLQDSAHICTSMAEVHHHHHRVMHRLLLHRREMHLHLLLLITLRHRHRHSHEVVMEWGMERTSRQARLVLTSNTIIVASRLA